MTRLSYLAMTSLLLGMAAPLIYLPAGVPAAALAIVSLMVIRRSNGQLKGKYAALLGIALSAVALLLHLFFNPEEEKKKSAENLKQIGLAIRNSCEKESKHNWLLPLAVVEAPDGNALLSWRVAILPQLGYEELYSRFKLDEPWDSPHNLQLLPQMPADYVCPRFQWKWARKEGLTYYQVFNGEYTAMGQPPRQWLNGKRERARAAAIANKIGGQLFLVVEADEPVPWTKPEDIAYDAYSYSLSPSNPVPPLPKLGGSSGSGFNALFADGHVQFVPEWTDEKNIRGSIYYAPLTYHYPVVQKTPPPRPPRPWPWPLSLLAKKNNQ